MLSKIPDNYQDLEKLRKEVRDLVSKNPVCQEESYTSCIEKLKQDFNEYNPDLYDSFFRYL